MYFACSSMELGEESFDCDWHVARLCRRMNRRASPLVLSLILLLCACSGPPETAGQNGPSAEGEPEPDAREMIPQYETFNAAKYVARPPNEAIEVDHRVPVRLLRGRADEGVKRRVQGYRIQVFSALEKTAAQSFRQRVQQWWQESGDEAPEVFRDAPPIVVMYSQPYYRVRLGAFVERDDAEEGLDFVRSEYPKAFIARSTVTVTR